MLFSAIILASSSPCTSVVRSIPQSRGALEQNFFVVVKKKRKESSGMILASGARGREFDSRITPCFFRLVLVPSSARGLVVMIVACQVMTRVQFPASAFFFFFSEAKKNDNGGI